MRSGRLAAIDIEQGRFDDHDPAVDAVVGQRVAELTDQVDAAALARMGIEAIERL
jgi:hypothetical protein